MPRPTDPALVDALTGLSNERHFRILYDFAFAGGDRGIPLSLALMALSDAGDGSRRGEDDGLDPRIQRMGALLAGSSRQMDVVAHLGDGRFLALLVDCNLQGGLVYADRVHSLAEALGDAPEPRLHLGLATYRDDMDEPTELVDLVERCLEAALSSGEPVVTSRDL